MEAAKSASPPHLPTQLTPSAVGVYKHPRQQLGRPSTPTLGWLVTTVDGAKAQARALMRLYITGVLLFLKQTHM